MWTRCRSITELNEPHIEVEEVCRIRNARAVWIDHDLLVRDFPHLADSRLEKDGAIQGTRQHRKRLAVDYRESWLVNHCAIASKAQASQTMVNTKIHTTGGTVRAFRPPRYGRALIVEAMDLDCQPCGLLDIKGVGLRPGEKPTHEDHGDGLLPLREALEEYAYQQLIEGIFQHSCSGFHTLPMYGVLDLGFEIKMEPDPSRTFNAAAYVRPAHRRWPDGRELPRHGSNEHRLLWEAELLLRHYGVTSATSDTYIIDQEGDIARLSYRGTEIEHVAQDVIRGLAESCHRIGGSEHNSTSDRDARQKITLSGINIQTTGDILDDPPNLVVLDFGHFEVHERFEDHLLSLVSDRPLMWGGVLTPFSSDYIEPAPEIAVNEKDWGWILLDEQKVKEIGYPAWYNQLTRLELFCLGLARDYSAGSKTGLDVKVQLDALVKRSLPSNHIEAAP